MLRRLLYFLPLLLAAAARADESYTLTSSTTPVPAIIRGLQDGKLAVTRGGLPQTVDLSSIARLSIPYINKFDDAELLRASDPKSATAFYKEALRTINSPAIKRLVELRAVAPADADGQFTLALNYFLNAYLDSPTDAVWAFRPTHLPNPGSSLLAEAADRLALTARSTEDQTARKNLKTFQLELLTRAGNTQAAKTLAQELSTGIAPSPSSKPPTSPPQGTPNLPPDLAKIDASLRSGDAQSALDQCDILLSAGEAGGATGDRAIQLFFLKASALESLKNPDLAIATLLRIPAHYPSSPTVPAALLQAATLAKRANHPAAMQALVQELLKNYPDAPETLRAKSL